MPLSTTLEMAGLQPTPGLVASTRSEDLLAHLTDGVIVVDHDWRIAYVNPEVERSRGVKAKDLLGRGFWEKSPEWQGGEAEKQLRRAMDARSKVHFEQRATNNEGIWFDVHAFPYEEGIAIHNHDITGRKKAEEARVALAPALESTDAIITEYLDGTILSWNPGAERIFGYTAEEAIGRPISMLLIPDEAEEVPTIMDRVKQGQRVDHYRSKRRAKDGRIVTVSLTVSPIKNERGEVVGASKVAHDITESERSWALQGANDALRRANADLEQFSSAAAHDLQEPLRMVTTYSQLLKRKYAGQLDAEANEFIRYCVEGATRMGTLVEDLLVYAQSASHFDEQALLVDLNRVVVKALANLQVAIAASKATVVYEALPEVRAHETLLLQLFQNLISNGIKYHNGTTPVITITAIRQDGTWLFSVNDNGIGIPAEYRKIVFAVFKRLHPSSEYPGTGLGLAICQRIVERYGGKIWVESEESGGATFFFTLPD